MLLVLVFLKQSVLLHLYAYLGLAGCLAPAWILIDIMWELICFLVSSYARHLVQTVTDLRQVSKT